MHRRMRAGPDSRDFWQAACQKPAESSAVFFKNCQYSTPLSEGCVHPRACARAECRGTRMRASAFALATWCHVWRHALLFAVGVACSTPCYTSGAF